MISFVLVGIMIFSSVRSFLVQAYKRMHVGLTYGGTPSPLQLEIRLASGLEGGAPDELQTSSDATFHRT